MALRQEQKEFLKFRKSLDKALRESEILKIDYEYDLGKEDVMDDSKCLLGYLTEVSDSLKNLRRLMK